MVLDLPFLETEEYHCQQILKQIKMSCFMVLCTQVEMYVGDIHIGQTENSA
jgi:hypothetical protein